MTVVVRTAITSTPSSTKISEAARYINECLSLTPNTSRTTSTTVCIAIPPRMLPVATPRLPRSAALEVMAISGRLVTIARIIRPPSASPSPK
jgi:hypothetical protein